MTLVIGKKNCDTQISIVHKLWHPNDRKNIMALYMKVMTLVIVMSFSQKTKSIRELYGVFDQCHSM